MANILTKLTEAAWFDSIMKSLESMGVPVSLWTGKRHPGLAWTKYISRALATADQYFTELELSLFIQTAIKTGLIKRARDAYQLEPFPAVAQVARFTITLQTGAPNATLADGDVTVGLVGGALEWVNIEPFALEPGIDTVVLFRAREQGANYNIPSGSPLELRTTIIGAAADAKAVGAATQLGAGASALLLFAKRAGVTVVVVNDGANQILSVTENVGTGVITVHAATDGGGIITSTADDVRVAIQAADELLTYAKNFSTGSGLIAVTAAPVALDWSGDYIQVPGADVETPDSLRARCLTRFMGLGGWAGDGAPPAPVSTDEAMEYWARAAPAGEVRSVVSGVKVLPNFLNGMPSGKDITVMVWKTTGQLSVDELAKVDGNFYNGRKFSIGCDLHTETVTNIALVLLGTVNYDGASGYTDDEVRAAIVVRLTAYQQNTKAIYPGCTLDPAIISARIADALPDEVITGIILTDPPAPFTYNYDEWPVIDPSMLTIAAV